MTKKILIIGCPGPKANYLPGVPIDMQKYQDFFLSNYGGAWYSSEIILLKNPNRMELLKIMNWIHNQTLDHSIVVFSGHGWETVNGRTKLLLRDDEECFLKELDTKARRQLRIIDSCRAIDYEQTRFDERLHVSKALSGDEIDISKIFRRKYEQIISKCENGISTLYACSINETAGENENGGYFSPALIEIGLSVMKKRNSYFDIRTVLDGTKNFIEDHFEDASQNPTMNIERRINYFPWSLSL